MLLCCHLHVHSARRTGLLPLACSAIVGPGLHQGVLVAKRAHELLEVLRRHEPIAIGVKNSPCLLDVVVLLVRERSERHPSTPLSGLNLPK